jgi:hypothetical protein
LGYNARQNPQSISTGSFASIATNGSAHQALFSPTAAGQIIAGRFVNGATSSVASGTTAGSSMNVYVLKGEIASASTASTVCSRRLPSVATFATATLTMSTSTAVTRFSAGDVYIAHVYGGVGNDRNNAGCIVQVDYMYAHAATDDTTI